MTNLDSEPNILFERQTPQRKAEQALSAQIELDNTIEGLYLPTVIRPQAIVEIAQEEPGYESADLARPFKVLSLAVGASLLAACAPTTSNNINVAPTPIVAAGHRFNPAAAGQTVENQKPNTDGQEVFINPVTGEITPVLHPSNIFPEHNANSSVYFCAEAPKGQAELRDQFVNNKYVKDSLLALGLNPNNPHFLSDQPMPISQTKQVYIDAGFSPEEAAKLSDPKAQMSPFQVGGSVKSASVNFLSDDLAQTNPDLYNKMKANPDFYERNQGVYLESERLVWPVAFSKMSTMGGATIKGLSMSIMIPAEYATNLGDDYDVQDGMVGVVVDGKCCQPYKPGKPTPKTPAQPPVEVTTPPVVEETPVPELPPVVVPPAPAPKPPVVPEQPKPFTVEICTGIENGQQVFISTTPEEALRLAQAKGYGGSVNTKDVRAVEAMQQHLLNYCAVQPTEVPTPTGTAVPPTHHNGGGSPDTPTPTSGIPNTPDTPIPTAPATNTATVVVTVGTTPTERATTVPQPPVTPSPVVPRPTDIPQPVATEARLTPTVPAVNTVTVVVPTERATTVPQPPVTPSPVVPRPTDIPQPVATEARLTPTVPAVNTVTVEVRATTAPQTVVATRAVTARPTDIPQPVATEARATQAPATSAPAATAVPRATTAPARATTQPGH